MFAYVRVYSPRTKKMIRGALEELLSKQGLEHWNDNILTCIDELVKNAVKANYKYLLIRKIIEVQLPQSTAEEIDSILGNVKDYHAAVEEYVHHEMVAKYVRTALTQEASAVGMKVKLDEEKPKYTETERKKLEGFTEILNLHRLMKQYQSMPAVFIQQQGDTLTIEVTNNAPISELDLQRINDKRTLFREYTERGEETLFFLNHMDESDGGAGLGYATIDSSLRQMNLNPEESLYIFSVSNTTVLLYLPLKALREATVE